MELQKHWSDSLQGTEEEQRELTLHGRVVNDRMRDIELLARGSLQLHALGKPKCEFMHAHSSKKTVRKTHHRAPAKGVTRQNDALCLEPACPVSKVRLTEAVDGRRAALGDPVDGRDGSVHLSNAELDLVVPESGVVWRRGREIRPSGGERKW